MMQAWCLLVVVFSACLAPAVLAEVTWPIPAVAIIIDDIGYRHQQDREVMTLPGALAVSILPHTPYADEMARMAAAAGKDVMLHVPMEPIHAGKNASLGPGALMLNMDRVELMSTLNQNLRAVPTAIGVNNHMGSLLTGDTQHMQWLMESLRIHNKFFVDSVTSDRSVAADVARRKGVPSLRRDVFLDDVLTTRNLYANFQELIKVARRQGSALAIGHPHPETIALLREQLPQLAHQGVRLISVPHLLRMRAIKGSGNLRVSNSVSGHSSAGSASLAP